MENIARRDKKAFLSDQCKEIEENSRIGKTRDLFKKIGESRINVKMGSIKDRNGKDRTEAEDIKKRWQEYTELYKKDLLCCPLLLSPSIFPSIRVFSNESVHIRWPKYWSFNFNISPSTDYSGLISFRMD